MTPKMTYPIPFWSHCPTTNYLADLLTRGIINEQQLLARWPIVAPIRIQMANVTLLASSSSTASYAP